MSKMNVWLLSSLLASGLILAGGNAYADNANHETGAQSSTTQNMNRSPGAMYENQGHGNIKGEVVGISGDTVKVKDTDGIVHTLKITGFEELQNLQAETLEKGDHVEVLMRNGKPFAITKVVESWSANKNMPNSAMTDNETVKGRVVKVNGDTIKVQDNSGIIHTFQITGFEKMEELQSETIQKGDLVVINMRDGKVYGISKRSESWLID